MKILIYKLFTCSILILSVSVCAENMRNRVPENSLLLEPTKITDYLTIENQEITDN